MLRGQDE